ncbi:hypothetical protein BO71DRAFT_398813, partial [Aspergillus ellipticus CBS 707.79]
MESDMHADIYPSSIRSGKTCSTYYDLLPEYHNGSHLSPTKKGPIPSIYSGNSKPPYIVLVWNSDEALLSTWAWEPKPAQAQAQAQPHHNSCRLPYWGDHLAKSTTSSAGGQTRDSAKCLLNMEGGDDASVWGNPCGVEVLEFFPVLNLRIDRFTFLPRPAPAVALIAR